MVMFEKILPSLLSFVSISLLVFIAIVQGRKLWVLFESEFTRNADHQLSRLFVFADPSKIFWGYIAILLTLLPLTWMLTESVVLVLMLAGALIWAPRLLIKILSQRRKLTLDQQLPDVLDQIAGSMVAGSTFVNAVQHMVDENSGPVEQEFTLFLRELRVGSRLEEALDNLGERVGSEDMDLVVGAVLIARDVGGNLAETFSRLSGTLRRKQDMEKKIKALTAQGVLQGWVVCALPFAMLLLLTLIEPEAVHAFWNSLLGWIFFAIVLILELLGGAFIRNIVRIDV